MRGRIKITLIACIFLCAASTVAAQSKATVILKSGSYTITEFHDIHTGMLQEVAFTLSDSRDFSSYSNYFTIYFNDRSELMDFLTGLEEFFSYDLDIHAKYKGYRLVTYKSFRWKGVVIHDNSSGAYNNYFESNHKKLMNKLRPLLE